MVLESWLILATGGLVSGILAGFLGIGGGVILVPLLITLGYTPVQAVATSSLGILINSVFGSYQNWKMGYLNFKPIIYLGLPAVATAQIGVYLASRIPPFLLLFLFGVLLIFNIYLVQLRNRLLVKQASTNAKPAKPFNPLFARILTGGAAGILAGLFGVGGGVIMVPLQMLLLGEKIKVAIQTSLAVIVVTAVAACVGHAVAGNVLFIQGIILGSGGLLGVQVSTRTLPKLPDRLVSLIFRVFLAGLSVYFFWEAWQSFQTI